MRLFISGVGRPEAALLSGTAVMNGCQWLALPADGWDSVCVCVV